MKRPVVQRAAHSYLLGLLAKGSIARGWTPETSLEKAWWLGVLPDVLSEDAADFTLDGKDWVDLLLEEGEALENKVTL